MIKDELQNMCVEMCAEKRRENENIILMCRNLLDILNGLIKEGKVLPEQTEPIIEQGQHVLETLAHINYGLNKFLALNRTSLVNGNNVEQDIEEKRELLSILCDFDGLDVLIEGFIGDSRRVIENWCNQKWLNGKSDFDFDRFLREYKDFSSSINCRLIPVLEAAIQELYGMSMTCVYASPEVMGNMEFINETADTYPLIHSKDLAEYFK